MLLGVLHFWLNLHDVCPEIIIHMSSLCLRVHCVKLHEYIVFKGVLSFWLDLGVDGFRVDAMRTGDEAYNLTLQFREFFDQYEKDTGRDHM